MELGPLTEIRRDLHRHAELGFMEFRTASRVEDHLAGLPLTWRRGAEAIDLSQIAVLPEEAEQDFWAQAAIDAGVSRDRVDYFRRHGTALVAEIEGTRDGPIWAVRSDMDALPIAESAQPEHRPQQLDFRSRTPAMHACGHDAHTAIGIGLLHRLAADRDFPGTVRVLFQPAEEGVRGARGMIAAGVLKGVDAMLAVHVLGDRPLGTLIGSVTGAMATEKLRIRFRGRASHAAVSPEDGRNALIAAAMASLGIMSLPRFSAADTRLNVGTLHAGDNVNIVPETAELTCEARAADDDVLTELIRRVRRVVEGVAHTQEVDHDIAVVGASCTISPTPSLVEEVLRAAQHVEALQDRLPTHFQPASDDMHLMVREVQDHGGRGAYINIGGASPGPHHSPTFDLEERFMLDAVDVLEAVVRGRGDTEGPKGGDR
ncbi:amidohydrolase [Aeromicrobium piscarium]|uniref:Amidohydrolase n=2 Tax=Aeromicrobium piscarium TaxID=2590901 RepID=A0A554SD77_9ACTN|nr:amidohydrolase [Aeromicrobium piscarium]TSD64286.1 amidohydrolase [Aeromicrobium piscarium]